jgi:predicted RNA-binding protein YlxR (DUF448 family)
MIRLVLGDDDTLAVDLAGRSFGRGAWVHPRVDCLVRAARGGASKAFKRPLTLDPGVLISEVRRAADRRVEALLSSARGAGRTRAGSEVARAAYESGEANLILVALDGRATVQAGFVAEAGAAGRAVAWGTKEQLGRAVGRQDTAVVAINDVGFAQAITVAVALSSLPEPDARNDGAEQALVEVR